jgi:hypothetical protein
MLSVYPALSDSFLLPFFWVDLGNASTTFPEDSRISHSGHVPLYCTFTDPLVTSIRINFLYSWTPLDTESGNQDWRYRDISPLPLDLSVVDKRAWPRRRQIEEGVKHEKGANRKVVVDSHMYVYQGSDGDQDDRQKAV